MWLLNNWGWRCDMRDWQIAIFLGIGTFYLYAFLWTGDKYYDAHWATIFEMNVNANNVDNGEPP